MTRLPRLLVVVATAVALTVSCGGGKGSSTSSSMNPLADAFSDQLVVDAGNYWFHVLDRDEVRCFAAMALDTIGAERATELRFLPDNIPLLFDADWTDAEIDSLTEVFDSCVADDTTGTQAYMMSLIPQSSRYADCLVPDIVDTLGNRYWIDQFHARFQPPRVEMLFVEAQWQAALDGEEPAPPAYLSDVEPVFKDCIPGFGEPYVPDDPGTCPDDGPPEACVEEETRSGPVGSFAEDACGGEPCEDPPLPGAFRRVVAECSRDPYAWEIFTVEPADMAGFPDLRSICQRQGRGTLISLSLPAYPCLDGGRDLELAPTGEVITEETIDDACRG